MWSVRAAGKFPPPPPNFPGGTATAFYDSTGAYGGNQTGISGYHISFPVFTPNDFFIQMEGTISYTETWTVSYRVIYSFAGTGSGDVTWTLSAGAATAVRTEHISDGVSLDFTLTLAGVINPGDSGVGVGGWPTVSNSNLDGTFNYSYNLSGTQVGS